MSINRAHGVNHCVKSSSHFWAALIVQFGWQWLGLFVGSQLVGGLYQGLVVAPNHKGMQLYRAIFAEMARIGRFCAQPSTEMPPRHVSRRITDEDQSGIMM